MISYCGIDCEQCPAFQVTIKDDEALRIETAKKWSSPSYQVNPDDVFCTGCKTDNGPHFSWCGQCPIRACASAKGVETCAHCDDFPCDKVEKAGEENLNQLVEIKKSLG